MIQMSSTTDGRTTSHSGRVARNHGFDLASVRQGTARAKISKAEFDEHRQFSYIQANRQTGSVTGSEGFGPTRPLQTHPAPPKLPHPARITLKTTEKHRPQPDRENAFARASGGGGGSGVERSLPPKSLLCRHGEQFERSSASDATEGELRPRQLLASGIQPISTLRTQKATRPRAPAIRDLFCDLPKIPCGSTLRQSTARCRTDDLSQPVE